MLGEKLSVLQGKEEKNRLYGTQQMDFSLGSFKKSFGPASKPEQKSKNQSRYEENSNRKRKPVSFFDPSRPIKYVEA